jgi:hypothetical protein
MAARDLYDTPLYCFLSLFQILKTNITEDSLVAP